MDESEREAIRNEYKKTIQYAENVKRAIENDREELNQLRAKVERLEGLDEPTEAEIEEVRDEIGRKKHGEKYAKIKQIREDMEQLKRQQEGQQ
jgi:chromosome segregation ATPase